LNYGRNMYIRHRCYKCTIFVRRRKNPITKQQAVRARTIAILASSGKMTKYSTKPGWRRKHYDYFKRLTLVCVVRGISGNIVRVKRKGNEAPHTLEGNERKRNCMNR
jgi:hypothetical protein